MLTLTFEFKDLPKKIFTDEKAMQRFTTAVETDIFYEFSEKFDAYWKQPTHDPNLLLHIHTPTDYAERMFCMMNNLYGAKPATEKS